MKIAVLCEYFYPDNSGGTPSDITELTCYLKQFHADIEIDVITSRHFYRPSGISIRPPKKEIWKGLTIYRLASPKSNRPTMLFRLLAGMVFSTAALLFMLRKPAYDLLFIVTNPPANAFAASVYSRLRKVPYVYFINDLYPDIAVALGRLNPKSSVTRLFCRIQKHWLHSAARIAVVGRCMQQHICSHYKVPLSRIEVVRNWADPLQIYPSRKENTFRQSKNLTGFVILYGGNFSRYVNFDQILEAARILRQNENIVFVLIGDGTEKAKILKQVETKNLKNVRVLPPVERSAMNEVLAASDVCLISLDSRMTGLGSPGKLYSIMASGRPIIAMVPPDTEVDLILKEEQCGVNVIGDDPAALAKEISRLKQDSVLTERMGHNARSALMRRFTLNHAGEQFYALFKEVLAET